MSEKSLSSKLNSLMIRVTEILKKHPNKCISSALIFLALSFVRYHHSKLIYQPSILNFILDAAFGKNPENNPYPFKNPAEHGL